MNLPNHLNPVAGAPRPEVTSQVRPALILASASRSAVTLAEVERAIAAHEAWFGRERLLRLVEAVPLSQIVDHVAYYRNVIRDREWPNETYATPLATFLDDYERASLAYVAAAFESMSFLASPIPSELAKIIQLVEASEALRGQFGKRSPTGLDARLDAYESELESVLDQSGIPDAPRALELLCTPTEPHLCAESMLLEDLINVQLAFPEAPTVEKLIRAHPERAEVAWLFLRRHAKWSLAQMHSWYHELNGEHLKGLVRSARSRRSAMADARFTLLDEIAQNHGEVVLGRIRELANALTFLNHLNLALEPCFSFKGCVGLAHGLVFRLSETITTSTRRQLEDIRSQKWALFSSTDRSQLSEIVA